MIRRVNENRGNKPIPKRFDFREAEPRIYDKWMDAKAFETAYDSEGNLKTPLRKTLNHSLSSFLRPILPDVFTWGMHSTTQFRMY